ncbi:MAG: hypothetical protein NT080_01255 [Spirochaetes bacterium]|nr:hypothetical protein [Spirochaetota bacterium]
MHRNTWFGALIALSLVVRVTPGAAEERVSLPVRPESGEVIVEAYGVFPGSYSVLAQAAGESSRWIVFQDGSRLGPYAEILEVSTAPGGKRTALVARDADGAIEVVTGGAASGPYRSARLLGWSPDGKRLAFSAENADGVPVTVVDGAEFPFAIDGTTVAFLGPQAEFLCRVTDSGGMRYAVEGRLLGDWAELEPFVLSPDGSSFAYAALDHRGRAFFCHNDIAYGPFAAVRFAGWASDGRTPGYASARSGPDGWMWFIMEAGRKIAGPFGPYPPAAAGDKSGSDGRPVAVVDPTGRRAAFVEADGKFSYVVETKTRFGPFLGVRGLRYSADGSRFAAIVDDLKGGAWVTGDGFQTRIDGDLRSFGILRDGSRMILDVVSEGGGEALLSDGKRSVLATELDWWTADGSLDGGFPSVVATRDGDDGWYVSFSGTRMGPFTELRFLDFPGNSAAFEVKDAGGESLYSGKIRHGPYDEAEGLGIDASGRLLYAARSGGAWTIRLGGKALGTSIKAADGTSDPVRRSGREILPADGSSVVFQLFDADRGWSGAIVVSGGRYLGRFEPGRDGTLAFVKP